MYAISSQRLLLLVLALLTLWAVTAYADAPAVTVKIVSPAAGAVVGGDGVRVENRVTHPAGITIEAVETQAAEVGASALTLPLSFDGWEIRDKDHPDIYPETWNTLPMHNGECRLTTLVVCQQGKKRFTVISEPVTVTVKNLWITKTDPVTAFFAVKAGESRTVTVDFDHYQAAGPYRVEYSFLIPGGTEPIRTVVHERVTAHQDSCVFTADKASLPWGAYVCFDIKVTCANDAATLISPTCKVIQDDAEVRDEDVSVVYALSEPPKPGGLTILCYSDLNFISKQEGLSEQCRDWEHPVVIPFPEATSFRSIYVGMDNHTDNRGRAPQPIMPES